MEQARNKKDHKYFRVALYDAASWQLENVVHDKSGGAGEGLSEHLVPEYATNINALSQSWLVSQSDYRMVLFTPRNVALCRPPPAVQRQEAKPQLH